MTFTADFDVRRLAILSEQCLACAIRVHPLAAVPWPEARGSTSARSEARWAPKRRRHLGGVRLGHLMSAFEAGVAVSVSVGAAVGGAVAEALGAGEGVGAGEEVGCMLLVGGVGEFGVGGG